MAKRTARTSRTARPSKILIPTRRAHAALQLLLDQLAKADTRNLQPLKKGKGAKTEKFEQWEEALRTTMIEIDEWCPSFTMSLDPKPRERRSTRARH